jgi:YHS domain-containing protein
MKIKYLAAVAIASILGVVMGNSSYAIADTKISTSNSVAIQTKSKGCASKPNPCAAKPCSSKPNPCAAKPCAGKPNPCAAKPCASKPNPCAAKPCAGKPNPCAAKPCAGKPNPCAAKPCAGKPNPCAAKPCAGKNPCASKTLQSDIYSDRDGIALKGQDVVSYFTQGKPMAGSSKYTYKWKGATWQFSSALHRDLFAKNPMQYAPQYGGYCAKAVSEGNLAKTEADAWKIVDGKLYLNYDKEVQAQWMQDVVGNIKKADAYWPGVLNNKVVHR